MMLPSSLPLSHAWREFLEDVEASFQATDRGDSNSETTRDLPHIDAPALGTSHASRNERAEGSQMIPHAWTTGEEHVLVVHDADEQPHHKHARQSINHFAAAENLPQPSYSDLHGDEEGGQDSHDARLYVTNWNDRTHDHFFNGAPFNVAVDYNPSMEETDGSTSYIYDPSTLPSADAYQPNHELWLHGDPPVAQSRYDGKENVALQVLASKGLRSRRKVPLTSDGIPLSIVPFQNVANQITSAVLWSRGLGPPVRSGVLWSLEIWTCRKFWPFLWSQRSEVAPLRGAFYGPTARTYTGTFGGPVLHNRNFILHDYSHLVPLPSLEQLDLVWSLPPFEEESGVAPWAKTGLTTTKNGQSVKHRTAIYKIKCPTCTSWHKDQAQLQRHAKIHAKDPHAVCILCGMWVQNRPDKFNDHRRHGCWVVYTILVDHGAVKLWTTVYGLVHPRPKQFGRGDHFV
ncbi:hypothetical protein EXIGLDRAFT_833874 [Exidia glandulosa HHB12029]|uniref:C2H2-type domain-containing protein n=1 Tax=Exidia glandulosa HHB12029 TaxID=1314781 RepID=A0A165KBH1_EXIGL|nr:hypothetical protein EXIGLDRAFT_833874 [Exidia glandulosa HHB12029]